MYTFYVYLCLCLCICFYVNMCVCLCVHLSLCACDCMFFVCLRVFLCVRLFLGCACVCALESCTGAPPAGPRGGWGGFCGGGAGSAGAGLKSTGAPLERGPRLFFRNNMQISKYVCAFPIRIKRQHDTSEVGAGLILKLALAGRRLKRSWLPCVRS